MAQTVSGTFRIIDRASGPLRRMEEQARRTDRAMRDMGLSMDKTATQAQSRRYEEASQHLRNMQRETKATDRDMGRLGNRTDSLTTKLAKLGGALYGLTKIIQILKFPAMIAGVSLLVKWVGALGGGLVALMPKLTDLVGVVGAAPAVFTGLGLALGATKLAFSDFGKALSGNKEAIKGLTPEARKFLTTIKQYQPVMKELRQSAQRGLFPGLDEALRRAQRGVPMLKRLLGRAGSTVGEGVAGFTRSMTTDKMLADLEHLGNIGLKVVSRIFPALSNLATAFVNVGIAAGPFTGWLSKAILNGTKAIKVWAETGRETGRLGKFFDRTKDSLKTFGRILGNLWGTFKGIGHAARALGDDLWSSTERATSRWERWAKSAGGQATLRQFFDNIRGTLHETFGLIGDLGKAFFRLSNDRSMEGLVRKLREMVPLLEKVFGNTASELGGPLLDAVKGFLQVFSNTPYFGSFVKLLAQMANLVGWLSEKIPGVSAVILGITAYKLFGPAINAVRTLAAAWGLVATNATGAAGAQRAAVATATGGGVVGAGSVGGVAAVGGGLGVRGRYAALRRGGTAAGSQMTLWPTQGRAVSARRAISPTLAAGGAAMAGAARSFWPIAALFGLSGAVSGYGTGGVRGAVQGAASSATMGIFPAPTTISERAQKAYEDSQRALLGGGGRVDIKRGWLRRDTNWQLPGLPGGENPSMAQARSGIPRIQRELLIAQTHMKALSGDERKDMQGIVRALQDQLRLRKQIVNQGKIDRASRSVEAGGRAAEGLQRAYGIYSRKYGAAGGLSRTIGATRQAISERKSLYGAEATGESMLDWARQLEKRGGPKNAVEDMSKAVLRSMRRLNRHVQIVNGNILTGTKGEWKNIADAMTDKAEEARQRTSEKFTAIQRQAVGALVAMGFDRGRAKSLVQAMEKGGVEGKQASDIASRSTNGQNPTPYNPNYTPDGKARGGRILGRGLRDTVPVGNGTVAAPGELIVNRHTEARINRALRPLGTTLGLEVGREGRPHNWPIGGIFRLGRRENAATGRRQGSGGGLPGGGGGLGSGFGGGGIVALGRYLQSQGFAVGENPAFGGVAPVHVPNSYHYRGMALDVNADSMPGGEMKNLDRLFAWLNSNRAALNIAELLWRVPNHFDHLHVAMGGAGAAIGGLAGAVGGAGGKLAQIAALKAGKTGVGGMGGVLADKASALYAAGLTKAINRKLRRDNVMVGGGGGGGGGGGVTGKVSWFTGQTMASGLNAASTAGIALNLNPGTDTGWNNPTIDKWLRQRKRFRVNIAGHSAVLPLVDKGPAGFTGRAIDVTAPGVRALGFTTANFPTDATGSATALARGGRIRNAGWFGGGGSVTAKGPTILGIGDRGTETAHITRGGGRGSGGVRIGKIVVQNHRDGDIRKQIEREVRQAFDSLGDVLSTMPLEDDTEAVA